MIYTTKRNGKNIRVTPFLRFVERDGERILQQKCYEFETDGGIGQARVTKSKMIWIDVPFEKEEIR